MSSNEAFGALTVGLLLAAASCSGTPTSRSTSSAPAYARAGVSDAGRVVAAGVVRWGLALMQHISPYRE